ncbi:MAG TPA: hypothetical protein VFS21_07110 [Roseiflexaceae bacterium]|nr:hypothetical protein [Roseiflexaceae bacterium]
MNAYRLLLAQLVSAGHLPLLRRWLEFRCGRTRQGRRQPVALSARRCATLAAQLSDIQIADLTWRGLAPLDGAGLEPRRPFTPAPQAWVAPVGRGARYIYATLQHRTYYQLADGQILRLRPGELDLLARAGYPATVDDLLAALWQQIGPAHPPLPRLPPALKRWAEPAYALLAIAIGALDPDVWQGTAVLATWLHQALITLF